jgi:hypothetical protein
MENLVESFEYILGNADLILVDSALWVLSAPVGLNLYDFRFEQFLPCRHIWEPAQPIRAVARIGAYPNYSAMFGGLQRDGIALIHTPDEYLRCSQLENWYPLIEDLTPKSRWFDKPPSVNDISMEFGWPVFIKGGRQTSNHKRKLAIIDSLSKWDFAMETFANDPILRWQAIVVRKYVPLRPVEDAHEDRIPSSFEFRTFWWKGELVGFGPYWWDGKPYAITQPEKANAISVAQEACRRMKVDFLVVDMAQTATGDWIVIECNEGQESRYAGVMPLSLWQKIILIEKKNF